MVYDDSGFNSVAHGGCVQVWPNTYSYEEPATTTTVVETMEYDAEGRLVKKTVTTTTTRHSYARSWTQPWYSSTVQGF